MRLQRSRSRIHKGVPYYKWQVTLPSDAVEALGWEPGDELHATVEHGRLVITRD